MVHSRMQESGEDRTRVVTGARGFAKERTFFLSRGKREAGKAVGLKKV